jgi:RNA polymerase sigma-70 factor (ECF subfamily)
MRIASTISKDESDECLIKAIAAGSECATRTLYARHRVRVYHFITRIVWTQLRRRRDAQLDNTSAEMIMDTGNTPEQTALNMDPNAQLRGCIARMSREHREVIDLVYYQEKSVEEVAEIIQMPRNTVKTRMFCARKRLAQVLSTHQDFDHLAVSRAAEAMGARASCLALPAERQWPQVLAVELQKVERVHRVRGSVPAMQRNEHGHSVGDGRIAVGPVKPAAGVQAHGRAVSAHDQPIAVVLDLVNPSGRRLVRKRRDSGGDETVRTAAEGEHAV